MLLVIKLYFINSLHRFAPLANGQPGSFLLHSPFRLVNELNTDQREDRKHQTEQYTPRQLVIH